MIMMMINEVMELTKWDLHLLFIMSDFFFVGSTRMWLLPESMECFGWNTRDQQEERSLSGIQKPLREDATCVLRTYLPYLWVRVAKPVVQTLPVSFQDTFPRKRPSDDFVLPIWSSSVSVSSCGLSIRVWFKKKQGLHRYNYRLDAVSFYFF